MEAKNHDRCPARARHRAPAPNPFAGLVPLQCSWTAADGRQVEIAGDTFTLTTADGLEGFTSSIAVRSCALILDGERAIGFEVERRWLRLGGTWFRR